MSVDDVLDHLAPRGLARHRRGFDRARARDIHEAPDEHRWLSVAIGSTSPRRRGAPPGSLRPGGLRPADRENRAISRHRSLPDHADGPDRLLGRVQHAAGAAALRSIRLPVPHLDPLPPGGILGAADPACAESPRRPRSDQSGAGPRRSTGNQRPTWTTSPANWRLSGSRLGRS